MWSGTMKVGWVATPQPPYNNNRSYTIALKTLVKKTNIRSCPTLCSYTHVAIKKSDVVYTKNARYLRILGAKKRVGIVDRNMVSNENEPYPQLETTNNTHHLYSQSHQNHTPHISSSHTC